MNPSKTKLIQFCRNHPVRPFVQDIFLNGEVIEMVESYKYLCVTFDPKLSFSIHSDNTVAKVRKGMGAIIRIFRKSLSSQTLVKLYIALPGSVMFYAIEVTFPVRLAERKMYEKYQKFVCRLILNDLQTTTTNYKFTTQTITTCSIH